jgi:dynein heavy chain
LQTTAECEQLQRTSGRAIYQTPKAFLRFLETFKSMYLSKLQEVDAEAARIEAGLLKLKKAALDVEALRAVLEDEEQELRSAEDACAQLMTSLQKQSLEAEREAAAVAVTRQLCEVRKCVRNRMPNNVRHSLVCCVFCCGLCWLS